jgi:hypothetical protein
MRAFPRTLLALALAFIQGSPAVRAALRLDGAALRSGQAAPPTPILVELFTSEGCSDCPPADGVLDKLIATQPVAGAEVIGLGQHVDYWDQLGWKDRFSSAALTNRQHVYGAHFSLDSVYTPQMVVDGRAQFVGSDGNAARKAIAGALAAPHGVVRIDVDSDSDGGRPFPASAREQDERATARQGRQDGEPKRLALRITVTDLPRLGRGDRADIIVAITEDHLRSSVTRGENHGRTLTHAAVVRAMTTIGQAAEGASSARADIPIAADWQRDQLKVIAFVQEQRGRAILASAAMPLQNSRR